MRGVSNKHCLLTFFISFKSVFGHSNAKKLNHLKFIKDLLLRAIECSGISLTVYGKCSKILNTFHFYFHK